MHAALLELSPPALPDAQAVMERATGENFPVAARVLPRRDRRNLLAVYGFARLADELGDELVGDRLAALDWLSGEVERAYEGGARHVLLRELQRTIAQCALPREPLLRLIEANRVDQRVARYETWEQLQGYCELSANPVGELVLCVFGLHSPERVALSDRVCTALQLVEHLQDVREDAQRGRVYMPAQDLARFECSHDDVFELASGGTSALDGGQHTFAQRDARSGDRAVRADRLAQAIALEVERARELLRAGEQLVAGVAGRPKLALGAFVAGGRAALEQIEHVRFHVLAGVPHASRTRRLRSLAVLLVRSRAVEQRV
jgi:squalene synthase HpnC